VEFYSDVSELPEVVEGGPPAWHRPRWFWWALALVVVAGGLAWYVDDQARSHEAVAVTACEHRLREASELSELRLGAMANYLRPALWTTHGARQLHLADLMAEPASRVLAGVQRADRVCRAVSVRPWHFSLAARSNAAVAYSGALVTLVQAVAAQGRAYFHNDSTLRRLQAEAGID
jgi:hypothetical protein